MAWLNRKTQILVINAGSSSLKVALYDTKVGLQHLAEGQIQGIGTSHSEMEIEIVGDSKVAKHIPSSSGRPLLEMLDTFEALSKLNFKTKNILAVGHRIVHGGNIKKSQVLTQQLLSEIERLSPLAPLHNPAGIANIKEALDIIGKDVPQILVFDTVYHRTLPPKASTYGIPIELSEKLSIKRYGFHGIAHNSLWQCYNQFNGSQMGKRVISLQLGNGCSMAAILNGQSIDTTMGFTPGEGLLMGTRAGDLDSAIVEYLCSQTNKSLSEVSHLLNSESGLLGVSNLTNDMRTLCAQINQPKAALAIEIFCYRIIKYLGAYMTVLKGLDAILFSGGIGENSALIRQNVVEGLQWFGVKIDDDLNENTHSLQPGEVKKISKDESSVEVFVIGSNENAFIAEEVMRLIN